MVTDKFKQKFAGRLEPSHHDKIVARVEQTFQILSRAKAKARAKQE